MTGGRQSPFGRQGPLRLVSVVVTDPLVFCVGLNRTGTTTLGDACELLGFTRLGWVRTEQYFFSHRLLKAWERGDSAYLAKVASGYQVLEDLPWPLVYQEMAKAFPDAKFVLTRRASVDQWLESQTKHTTKGKGYGMHRKIYGALTVAEDPEKYRAYYERHLVDVRQFFDGTDRLAEFCWDESDGWPELCEFLGVPIPDVPFPHSNPSGWNPTPDTPSPRPMRITVRRKIRRTARKLHLKK